MSDNLKVDWGLNHRSQYRKVELVRNLMAHAQKPDFVFRLNGRVHFNRRGSQFSWLLAAEACGSALVMLDTSRSEGVWEYWLPIPFASFPFTSPPVRHRVPPHSERSIRIYRLTTNVFGHWWFPIKNIVKPHEFIWYSTFPARPSKWQQHNTAFKALISMTAYTKYALLKPRKR